MIIKKYKTSVNALIKYLLVVLTIFVLYIEASLFWVSLGGIHPHLLKFEIPLLMFMSTILYFKNINNSFIKYLIPTVPILTLYILFDIFYNFLERSPRISDIQNISTIFNFSYEMAFGFILLSCLIPISILFLFYQSYKKYTFKRLAVSLSYKLFLIFIVISTLSSSRFTDYITKSYEYFSWSINISIRNNGRFASFIYYGSQEKQNYLKIKKYISANNINEVESALYPGLIKRTPNIHFIVLESFIDPRLLENIKFSKSPLAMELISYLNKDSCFSYVVSPVYGGGTAQAEFELLTGVPALAKINSTEFNVLNGKTVSSFVNHIKELGYNSIATIASNKGFYNSPHAYKSLGFNKVSFLEESVDFSRENSDDIIFDGDLFNYNLNRVKNYLDNNNKPVFNYVLGLYGHFPYKRNANKRPDVIDVSNENINIYRISNQFYYRTKALAKYIKELISIDPNSIIYITSDHLPPIFDNIIEYKYGNHTNISLFINAGVFIDMNRRRYYEIPWFIWDLLSESEHKRDFQDSDIEELYFKLMSESFIQK